MNVLLLGGTGAIGSHLSSVLSTKGYQICVTSRKKRKDSDNIKYIIGNAKDLDFLKQTLCLRKWDSIVDFMCYSTKEFSERVDILLSNTRQYVYLSSARVYSDTDTDITEESERLLDTCEDQMYLQTDEYALYKAREEDILFRSGYSNYTILRPYITYGENRIPLGVWEKETWLRRALIGKNIAMPRKFMNKKTTLAYGKDVSSFIAEIICKEKAIGQIYNIVSSETQYWKDIANTYINEINKLNKSAIKIVEFEECCYSLKSILKCLLIKLKFKKSYYGCYSWSNYQLIYDREFNRSFDNSKTLELAPRYIFSKNDDSMRHCIREFVQNQEYSYTNYYWEMVQDRITKEKTPLSYFPTLKLKVSYLLIRYVIPSSLIYSK